MGDKGYELYQYEGGVRIPKVGIFGPVRLFGRIVPIEGDQVITLKDYPMDGMGDEPADVAAVKRTSRQVIIANCPDGASYSSSDIKRVVPISPKINRDRDLGGIVLCLPRRR